MMHIVQLRAVIAVMCTLAIASPAVAGARAVEDSAALRKYAEKYQAAWDTHDPIAVAAFFSEDADLIMGSLPTVRGRKAIEAWWRGYFERQEPGRRATFDLTGVRFLAADVAVVNLLSTTHGTGGGSEPLPVRKARGTWLVRRADGNWQIEAMRGMPTEEDRVELVSSLETAKSLRPDIRAFVRAYEDAFDRHDPEALSAFYRYDADIIVRNGPVIHGAEAIRQWWTNYFSRPRPYRVQLIIDEIRMMADDVAELNLVATGARLEAKAVVEPVRTTRALWILIRENDRWLIEALRVLPGENDRVIRN